MAINCSARPQWPEKSEMSRPSMIAGAMPSPCISSIKPAKLLAKSKTALAGASPSTRWINRRTSCAISSLRFRVGTGIGRSVRSGSCAKSVTKVNFGIKRAGPCKNNSANRLCMRCVLTKTSTRAQRSGGPPCRRVVNPSSNVSGKA